MYVLLSQLVLLKAKDSINALIAEYQIKQDMTAYDEDSEDDISDY